MSTYVRVSFIVTVFTILVGLTRVAYGTTLVSSSFDSGIEGWTCTSDCSQESPIFNAIGGNPGGYISAADFGTGDTWYFVAPETFLGDQSLAFGGTLSFDLQFSPMGTSNVEVYDVLLSDGSIELLFSTGQVPALAPDWTSYTVSLQGGDGWRVNSMGGPFASDMQLMTVLSNLERLEIRGEHSNLLDIGGLDNVVLGSARIPEPMTIALWAIGFTGICFMKHRQILASNALI